MSLVYIQVAEERPSKALMYVQINLAQLVKMTRLSARWASLTLFKGLADASETNVSQSFYAAREETYDEQKTCPHFVTLIFDDGHKHTGHVCFTVAFGIGWRCKRFLRFYRLSVRRGYKSKEGYAYQDSNANLHPGHRSLLLDFFECDRLLPVLLFLLMMCQLVFPPIGAPLAITFFIIAVVTS